MKKIIYIVLVALLFGCEKETMENNVSLDSIYQIKDNPDDAVQHERYMLQQEYNVAIFFTDTIGTVLFKHDVYGNPIYRTEMLDLGWQFVGYRKDEFVFKYITDETQKLEFLKVIRKYVTEAGPKLTPFSILAVNEMNIINKDTGTISSSETLVEGKFKNFFRTLVMTNLWKPADLKILPQLIMREMLKQKITNYKHLLGEFFEVSDKSWFGKGWTTLDNTITAPTGLSSFTAAPLYDDTYYWATYYKEQYRRDSLCTVIRGSIGKFGYVCGGVIGKAGGIIAPESSDNDLNGYVYEMLKNPGHVFDSLWGKNPLVMKKYEILRGVIFDNIGLEL